MRRNARLARTDLGHPFDAHRWACETTASTTNSTTLRIARELLAASDVHGEATISIYALEILGAAKRTSVKRAIKRLITLGMLECLPQKETSGATLRNRYILKMPSRQRGGRP